MRSPASWKRVLGAMTLLLTLGASLALAPATAQSGDSSIEVHSRVCPADYTGDNYYDDCHGNPAEAGLPFTFSNGTDQEGETDENGDVGFANLPEGTWTITGGAPQDATDLFAYCAVGTEEASDQQPVDVQYVDGGIQLDLPATTNVICDWYIIPVSGGDATPPPTRTPGEGGSSIEVHYRLCPADYSGDAYYDDCHGSPGDLGVAFTFVNDEQRDGSSNEEGNVGFGNLPAGTWTITGGVPNETTELVVYCAVGTEETSDQQSVDFEYVDGGIQFDLPANTNVICDWYTIAHNDQGDTFDLPVYSLACDIEPNQDAVSDFITLGTIPDDCQQAADISVSVTDAEGDEIGNCVTKADDACFVNVTIGTTVYGAQDPSTLPDGYAPPTDDPVEVEIPPDSEASLLFVNLPVEPEPTATATSTPLPPGRPLVVLKGDCAVDQGGDVAWELEDLRSPVDDEAASATVDGSDQVDEAVVAETSTTTVDVSLADLMEGDYSIAAFTEGPEPVAVACTTVDGTLNDEGELVIGLREQGHHGYTGIAYLAPSADASQTTITVFLAEGLAEDDENLATPGA